jgi:hypothetical protein
MSQLQRRSGLVHARGTAGSRREVRIDAPDLADGNLVDSEQRLSASDQVETAPIRIDGVIPP